MLSIRRTQPGLPKLTRNLTNMFRVLACIENDGHIGHGKCAVIAEGVHDDDVLRLVKHTDYCP